tara:strand:+ start:3220 stop:3522 length:303 start_codon:yes stop_codon:yes gene_type:complete
MNYSDEEVKSIIENYHKKKEYEKARYLIVKDTEDFINKNRSRAKAHYDINKESKRLKYQDNKEVMNAKSSYYYYKKNNKLDKFSEKNKEKYELLKSINFI